MSYSHYYYENEEKNVGVDPRTNILASELLKTIFTDETKTESLYDVFAKKDTPENPKFDTFFHEYGYDDSEGFWKFSFPSGRISTGRASPKDYDLAVVTALAFEGILIRGSKDYLTSDSDYLTEKYGVQQIEIAMEDYLITGNLNYLRIILEKYAASLLGIDLPVNWETFYKTIQRAKDNDFKIECAKYSAIDGTVRIWDIGSLKVLTNN